ncbi:MAG: TetR/AcrR family transcriptional regulator [Bifidobacteriaceae bacterium]|nr:TetR/AcrR family transcriptional regulator [Bifidobacteriaceae bacterium]
MRDPSATRQSLLDAGRAEFARHGLAGGRTDRIAQAAGASKERIYAYFGSKEGLFEAVVDDALEDLLDLVPMPATGLDSPAGLVDYVARVAEHHRRHPRLMRLVQWEALERSGQTDPETPRARKYRAKAAALGERLGIPPEEAAPLLVLLILLAAGPQAMSNLAGAITGLPPEAAAAAVSQRAARAAPAAVGSALASRAPTTGDPPPT